MSVIHNQALDAKLDHQPDEFGHSLAPTPSQRQPQGPEQLIAEGLLAFIVYER